MQAFALTKLRNNFLAAISSEQSDVTLDPAIAGLRDEISNPLFIEPFSIYSRGHLRAMNGALGAISNSRLKDDPLGVALAVDAVLKLFDKLANTIKRSEARAKATGSTRSG